MTASSARSSRRSRAEDCFSQWRWSHSVGADVVAGVEQLAVDDAPERSSSEHRRGFHLDGDAPLITSAGHLGRRLAEEGVGRPGQPAVVRHAGLGQHVVDRRERARVGLHLGIGGRVVVAGALVAHGTDRHDHVTDVESGANDARTPTADDLSGPE